MTKAEKTLKETGKLELKNAQIAEMYDANGAYTGEYRIIRRVGGEWFPPEPGEIGLSRKAAMAAVAANEKN